MCYCCGSLNSFCGRTDYIDHPFRLGEHRNVAAVDCSAAQCAQTASVFFARSEKVRKMWRKTCEENLDKRFAHIVYPPDKIQSDTNKSWLGRRCAKLTPATFVLPRAPLLARSTVSSPYM